MNFNMIMTYSLRKLILTATIPVIACTMLISVMPVMGKQIETPWPIKMQNLHHQFTWHQPGTERVLWLGMSTPYRGDSYKGVRTYKMLYKISLDGGKTYDKLRPVIQQGKQYDAMHPIRPVYAGINSYVASIPPPSLASNGEIMVPFYFWPLNKSHTKRLHDKDILSYTADGVLIGDWNKNKTDIIWHLGQTVHLNYNTQSTRGAMEPAIIELDKPGHFMMIMRASNAKNYKIPSYKWKSLSTDYCRTWSKPTPFTYADGKPFYSPSACSVIMRSTKNGKIYWFGNISKKNPHGNMPRYPLIVAQVNEKTLGLIKNTIRVIDTYDPAIGDTKEVQFSNFHVKENYKSGDFIVTLRRLDHGKLKPGQGWSARKWPYMKYIVPLHGKIKTTSK